MGLSMTQWVHFVLIGHLIRRLGSNVYVPAPERKHQVVLLSSDDLL